ncbi:beta-ketoacyl synthase N-terminal-like domain-containing protein, partial [Streptomyces sp. SID3212]|uniref:beta-ketoacyl synthase N-terminal-like domain-containing protein n=1 Tax=Streptomyces sp. SID3212 TaxID=2690259 RepID=UPI0013CDDF64|nr:non-ribosomal peptide synthetase [Streptomyces sp. SID3212]
MDVLSAEERDAFKRGAWNLRPASPDEPVLRLADPGAPAGGHSHLARSSSLEFAPRPLPYADLCALLARLRASDSDGRERRGYPSAGDTYAVHAYLVVRVGAVESLPGGAYYYDPAEHALRLLNPAPAIDRTAHFFYNRPLFDQAAFELYLISQPQGIEPLYGKDAERYLLLEAGYMGQLLMEAQQDTGVGLCPIGSVAFDTIRDQLRLDDGQRFLQSFLGGPLTDRPADLADPAEPAPARVPASGRDVTVTPAAVIGLAGRYPDAATPDQFWRHLADGRRSIAAPSADRAAEVGAVPGGYLADIDGFDSGLFRLSPAEAATLDPQLRQLLHAVRQCLEDAGHTTESLRRAAPRVGVYVATMWNDHQHVGAADWERTGRAEVSAIASDIPNRISHIFGFRGPSIAVNTSCSSSLTALHLALEALHRGDCDAAVVGAANLIAHPYHTALLEGLGLVAPDGIAGAFDDNASGWSPGEGVGALLLRRVEDARRDGDHVHGVVEGTWIDFAGGSGRFGAPDVTAFRDAMARTLDRAGVTVDDVSYVECAATGASFADAAEVEALGGLFHARAGDPVLIGTVKSAIGHLEAASGLAQVTKTLLQLRHRSIAPTPTAGRLSRLVDWDALPVRLADRPMPWRSPDGAAP